MKRSLTSSSNSVRSFLLPLVVWSEFCFGDVVQFVTAEFQ
jgi:hypothetical protein